MSTEKLYSLEKPKIKRNNFVKLMKIATSEVQFVFNNTLYCQTDGVAMGSPLGPTLANIFMGYLEYSVSPSSSSQIIYIRYMDDCLVISKTKEENEVLFDKLNSLHSMISFTREIEENNELPFLDILIMKNNINFQTTIYRKTTFTGQYLNYRFAAIVKKST